MADERAPVALDQLPVVTAEDGIELITLATVGGVSVPARLPLSEVGGGGGGGPATWGDITGTLADQTDLSAALAGKAGSSHSHSAATSQVDGFLTAGDKAKLDGIAAGAQVNLNGAATVSLLDAALGGTDWRLVSAEGGAAGLTLVCLAYNAADGTTVTDGSTGNVNYNTAAYALDSTVVLPTASPWEITINDTGEFYIEYDVGLNFAEANVKGLTTVTLRSDAGGSWATVPGSTVITSEAGSSSSTGIQNAYGAGSGYLNLATPGKKIAVQTAPASTNADVKTVGGSCNIAIYKVNAGGGSGGGSPITWYDEGTALGQQTKVKFTGAGVMAAVNGDTVDVTIAAQAAAAGGDGGMVQFNSGGAIAGAAGVTVKSPANGPGYTNHILHANAYTGGCAFETVAAGAGWWADSYHDVAYDVALAGAATLKGSVINVQNNNEIAATKVYLRNTTAAAVNVTIDTSDGHFTEIVGLSNPFSIDANATKIVYLTARKDGSGSVRKAVEG
ncbi:hypothetical protein DF3PA_80003 [Candidatus Defluviicoccus seviourii]|uniref:Uncharacterized protein n=1 Tax=Candidatus Defluviicoccus seviourii TaxID=2565273 RepID=A0A564WJP4_9PROT|nr:hypothetical protein DF3PA_80003 [Candidatus Defluviicoccus seviourii]